eukprot:5157439-Pleurochrysis_carterae.AAC.2
MHMWGAGRSINSARSEEVREIGGQKLAGVVAVEGADDSRDPPVAPVAIEKGGEGGDEDAHGGGSLALGTQHVHSFVSRVIVNKEQCVLMTSVV